MPERAQGQSCLCGWAGIKAKLEIYAVQVVVDIDAYIESIEGEEGGEEKRGSIERGVERMSIERYGICIAVC